MRRLTVSAPGRICLFGEHQDFLGLPVVAAAIDLRVRIEGYARRDSLLEIEMPDIKGKEVIDLNSPVEYTRDRDYLRSCINVLRSSGWDMREGYNCLIRGDIPINAGVSSSSALVVAWLRFLLEASGVRVPADELARLAHRAEVLEFNEPGGMMDHFVSALGGVVSVETRPPFAAERLDVRLDGFVLGDSLEKKRTLQVLSGSRADVESGIELLKQLLPDFDLHQTPLHEVEPVLQNLPEGIRLKVKANLMNRDLTLEAMDTLLGALDPVRLGRLLTRHHEQLRDGLGVSTPKIDRMLETALDAGALGGKINGSGGGGCMFAYAPGKQGEVAGALERAGGRAHAVRVDGGVREEVSAY